MTSKTEWKKWLCREGFFFHCSVVIYLHVPLPVSVFLQSFSKESSTTVWVSMWRISPINRTAWLPTIDGFTTNTTLTTLDRYEIEYSVCLASWQGCFPHITLEVHTNYTAHRDTVLCWRKLEKKRQFDSWMRKKKCKVPFAHNRRDGFQLATTSHRTTKRGGE